MNIHSSIINDSCRIKLVLRTCLSHGRWTRTREALGVMGRAEREWEGESTGGGLTVACWWRSIATDRRRAHAPTTCLEQVGWTRSRFEKLKDALAGWLGISLFSFFLFLFPRLAITLAALSERRNEGRSRLL